MFKVGVVGPSLSVERILDVGKEFESELTFLSYPYHEAYETTKIVKEHENEVDAWLFSGPIPYTIAKDALGTDKRLTGVFFLETGFYKSFLNLFFKKGTMFEGISIDIPLGENVVDEALAQLDIRPNNVYVKKFDAHIDYMKLYHHHQRLWKEGKIEAVLTCYPQVKELLENDGIAANWISTTRLETRQTLQVLVEKARAKYFKNTQIAVCIVEIEEAKVQSQKDFLSYDLQYTDLKMNEELLHLSRSLNGSFLKLGSGSYIIFSSRGEMEQKLPVLQKTTEVLIREWKRSVLTGIGFGDSAIAAEFNARRAVQLSKEETGKKIMIIDDDGRTVEFMNEENILSYGSSSHDELLVKKLQHVNVSVQTYEKVKACVDKKGWTSFTTKDLALELNMSDRNAQRIVSTLCKAELLKDVGETKKHNKGRPSKLYTFSR